MASRFLAILLLLLATGSAAPPAEPDASAGRTAFNRLLAQAEAAWQESRTEEALRCYQIAKKVARAHKLTLSDRDEALMAFITRHEAGQTNEQTGRQPPACETDSTTASLPPAAKNGPRTIPDPPNGSPEATGPQTSDTTDAVIPDSSSPSRAISGETIRTLVPAVKPNLPDTSPGPAVTSPATPETSPARPSTTKAIAVPHRPRTPLSTGDSTTLDEHNNRDAVSTPTLEDDQSNADPLGRPSADRDDGLVPAVTTPTSHAPTQQPTRNNQDGDPLTLDVESPTGDSPPATEIDQPVKLTVDRQAVSITLPDIGQPDSRATQNIADSDVMTSTGMPTAAPGPISDRHLILMMFGPIVLALFLLGLLTQEMPSPRRVLAWLTRRSRKSQPDTQAHVTSEQPVSIATETVENELPVTIGTTSRDKVPYYTATIELPGVEPARIVKRRDGSPRFRSRAAALSSARHVARRLGYTGVVEAKQRKKAA